MSAALPRLRAAITATAITVASMVVSGCRPDLPPSKPLSDLTPQEASGHAVFQSNCARCHNANSQDGLRGPGLQGLYKLKYLPSGAPANDDRVISAIEHGRGMMPSFANKLDEQQLNDLIAYLHTL